MQALVAGRDDAPAGIGGAAGIAVAWAGARLIVHLAFQDAWVPVSASPSVPVLLFALAVSLMTALLFGIVPAWITSRADPMDAMRGSTRTAASMVGRQDVLRRTRAGLAVQARTHVVVSMVEQAGDRLYHTAFLLSDRGTITGRYRKTHLDEGERRWAAAGDDLPVFETPLGRIAQVEDIAPVAVFFASADSQWITGETLRVAGGLA